ncbi:MAG: lipocalin family protein [Deltaproteobacteria bacterium]|nr:lipocalin family protein [Deltaproteobacteria bacterium]
MMTMAVACAVMVTAGCAGHPSKKGADQTVESVELGQYMGRWYVIASLPVCFQKNCYCVTAEYSMQKDYVAVINTCRKGSSDGPLKVSAGKAFVVPDTGNAQLKVQFFWPFKGDYWIIALDEGYEYAMVGHPRKKYLRIMSRDPSMEEETYAALIDTAREKGYDVGRLKRIPQDCD